MNSYIKSIAIILTVLTFSCKEDTVVYLEDDDAPDPITNVQVYRLPGAAKITYSLPKSKSLRYVKAEFEIKTGHKEVKASHYTNSLIVEGFSDTLSYEVKLYSVSNGEKISKPVTVNVKPLLPPLIQTFKSLEMKETFGGILINFENDAEANLSIIVLSPDRDGLLNEVDTYYTKIKNGSFAVRGFENKPREFGVLVRDRWGNLSDTSFVELTPLAETQLNKNLFKQYNLSGDVYLPHSGATNTMDKIWDGIIAPNGGSPIFHTIPGNGIPQQFTFDLGVTAQLSRFKFFHRGAGNLYAYKSGDPKIFEIWGSNNPDPSGSWDGWIKLDTYTSKKPSGLPVGTDTNEDLVYATTTGEDFNFPDDIPPVRYIRFRTLETWGLVDYIYISELTFWGQVH